MTTKSIHQYADWW